MKKFKVKLENDKSSSFITPREIKEFEVYALDIKDACERASIKIMYLTDGNKPTYSIGLYSGFIHKTSIGLDLTFSVCLQNVIFQK